MCAVNLPYTFSQLTLSFFGAQSELTLSFFQTYPSFFDVRSQLTLSFCARGRELPYPSWYVADGVTLYFVPVW